MSSDFQHFEGEVIMIFEVFLLSIGIGQNSTFFFLELQRQNLRSVGFLFLGVGISAIC